MKNIIKRVVQKYRKEMSKRHLLEMQKQMKERLQNSDFTIIANNCVGGVIYHDFGVQFNSPTINMAIFAEDYIEFLEKMDAYLNEKIIEDNENTLDYPIAILGNRVRLLGIHYANFKEMEEAWEKRKARINKNNLFIIGQYIDGCTMDILEAFCNLPYENKVFFTNFDYDNPCVVNVHVSKWLYGKNVPGADVFVDTLGTRFYYKHFDFANWLNTGDVKSSIL